MTPEPAPAEGTETRAQVPLTGAYYWFPRPHPEGPSWELLTCHDLGAWDGISHREFWPLVVEHLAAAWGKDAGPLKRRLLDRYTGLPRGRITHPKTGYLIIHGDDAPVADWRPRIKDRFRLRGVKVRPLFDEHERMLAGDPEAVEAALGLRLGLPGVGSVDD